MEESGRFPLRMKFEGDGTYPKALEVSGIEKSFISLFIMTPVSGTRRWEPKRRLMVVVRLMAIPEASAVTTWDVPGLQEFR